MMNFGPLAAEIGSGVCGTTANFNGFLVLVSLLQPRRSSEASQTLHDVWPSPGLLHYIYIFGGSCPLTEFRHMQNSLCVQVLRSRSLKLAALLHGSPAKLGGVVQRIELRNFRRRRHLYTAGRPSHWASAHILVFFFFSNCVFNTLPLFSFLVKSFSILYVVVYLFLLPFVVNKSLSLLILLLLYSVC